MLSRIEQVKHKGFFNKRLADTKNDKKNVSILQIYETLLKGVSE